jgi:hypothetical protein
MISSKKWVIAFMQNKSLLIRCKHGRIEFFKALLGDRLYRDKNKKRPASIR